jgi:WD40 repeat protein
MRLSTSARLAVILTTATTPLVLAEPTDASTTPTTVRVSVSSTGGQANARSQVDAISPDGRFVLFDSWASNLVRGDTNGVRDLFLRDLKLGRTTRVSVGPGGRQANGSSHGVAISGDGRFVLFTSLATNLTNQVDRNHAGDVFVRTRLRAKTFRVSVAPGGGQFTEGVMAAGISDNGRWVAMGGGGRGPCDFGEAWTYVRDRVVGATRRVGGCGNAEALSPDGQWLVVGGSRSLLRLRNLWTGRKTDIGGPFAVFGGLTADGHYVTYSVLGESERVEAWRWNRITGRTRLIHRCGFTSSSGGYRCEPIGISGDGRSIGLLSDDPTLVNGDTNTATDLLGVNMATKAITRLDVSSTGTQITKGIAEGSWDWSGPAHTAVLSSDGHWAAFTSADGLAVPGDTNHAADVFLRGPLR